MILKGGFYVNELNEKIFKDFLIEDGKVTKIEDNIDGENIIDCTNKLISLSFVDVHVHLREPGYSEKETIKSGTKAAARGGYTKVYSMPNVSPVPSTKESVQTQIDLINKDAYVDVIPYGSISYNLQGSKLSNMEEMKDLVCAYTDDGLGVFNDNLMKEAMIKAKTLDKMIVAHCEDDRYVISDNRRAEYDQVKRDVDLVKETNAKYHVCHISTKESLEYVKEAKDLNLNVTCEITPHHLLLDENDIKENTFFKMNPPLRLKSDKEACIEALQNGIIDMIATDHAPHTLQDKECSYEDAANGVVGLETSFNLLYTYLVKKDIITLRKLIELMAINPRLVFEKEKLELKVGINANITVIDLEKTYTINSDDFYSLGVNTPFNKMEVDSDIIYTIHNGKVIYKRG